jgi:predicted Zn-dependent protease
MRGGCEVGSNAITRAAFFLLGITGCAGGGTTGSDAGAGPSDTETALAATPGPAPVSLDADGTYLQPNAEGEDGQPIYVHVMQSDMPWRIALGTPRVPPRYGSARRAREVAIEAMQQWETAIQAHLSWFRLEFVEDDPTAPVQVVWKRRIASGWAGFGAIQQETRDGRIEVRGRMEISTTPGLEVGDVLSLEEVRYLVAHEFGHVLGLQHCLDCDSAMNYSWHTRDRVFVTETDVRTFLVLMAIPNGSPGR